MNGTSEPANRQLLPVSITAPSRVATRMAKTITAMTSIGIYKLEEAQLTSTPASLAEEGQWRKWFSVSSGCRATPARS